jgi:uncharacterized protein YndB with AHSA1/START domain
MPDSAAPEIRAEGEIWRCQITRAMGAPVSQVWRAFEDPVRLAAWFGPEGLTTTIESFDFREGGGYALTMVAEDGRSFPLKGRFVTIDPGRKLTMTWLWLMPDASGIETQVTFDLSAEGDGTSLILTHERFGDADNAAGHGEGWESSLRKLTSYLAH